MLCDDIGERFFGEGPCRLLHRIEETGSLRAAAQAMGLSYSKALRRIGLCADPQNHWRARRRGQHPDG